MRYNVLDEPWIPVLRRNGTVDRVGIRAALAEAGSISQLASSNPIDNVALYRLLLAVLQWCKPSPTEDERKSLQSSARGIPLEWLEPRLAADFDAFDLFSATRPFYQHAISDAKPVSVTNLLHDLPSATNIAHFRHTRDGLSSLCLACCALGLVRWSAVASAGTAGAGQSMTATPYGNTPAYSISHGASLLDTILNDWPVTELVPADAPAWAGAHPGSPLGFLKGMTWQSRAIQLILPEATDPPPLPHVLCCHCGNSVSPLISRIRFRPGWVRPEGDTVPGECHLLRVDKSIPGSKRSIQQIPVSAGPNDLLDEYGAVWRVVIRGLLQRIRTSPAKSGRSVTLLLANNQALYKDAVAYRFAAPVQLPEVAVAFLLGELDWLLMATAATTAANAAQIRKPPKRQPVLGALAHGHGTALASRSFLCQLNPALEHKLESEFVRLVNRAAAPDSQCSAWSGDRADWRRRIARLLYPVVKRAAAIVPGSILDRRNYIRRAAKATYFALKDISHPHDQPSLPPSPADQGRSGRRCG